MNKDAGRGGFLEVTLQLENGEKLPFILDTGAGFILIDESLAPKLGKPIGTVNIQHWGKHEDRHVYAAPKLYLGGVLLPTGDSVVASDFKDFSKVAGHRVMGVLGMDALQHYCLQLDFTAGKIRFLDDQSADTKNWGQAFPIVALNANDPRPAVAQNLLGAQGPHSLIDSGYGGRADGWLMPKFFEQWTNQTDLPAKGEAHSPDGVFGGKRYSSMFLDVQDVESDGIGLRFLARHLVTLDFPKHTLYLKRTSDFPLMNKATETRARSATESAGKYMVQLVKQGQLPGISKEDHGTMTDSQVDHTDSPYRDSVVLNGRKNGDSSFYHYTFIRTSQNGGWKLQKARRTDENGKVLQEYPVP